MEATCRRKVVRTLPQSRSGGRRSGVHPMVSGKAEEPPQHKLEVRFEHVTPEFSEYFRALGVSDNSASWGFLQSGISKKAIVWNLN